MRVIVDSTKEQLAKEAHKETREDRRFNVEKITACLVFAYATIAFFQWCEMKNATKAATVAAKAAQQSAKTAKDSLIFSHRPWFGIEGFPELLEPITITKDAKNVNVHTSYGFIVKNFGTAIGLHAGVYSEIVLHSTSTSPEEFEKDIGRAADSACRMADIKTTPIHPNGQKIGPYIFPDNRQGFSFNGPTARPNADLTTNLRIVGCIAY